MLTLTPSQFDAIRDVLGAISELCSDCICKDGKIILRGDKSNILVDIRFPFNVDFTIAVIKNFIKVLKVLKGVSYQIGKDDNYTYFIAFKDPDAKEVKTSFKLRNVEYTSNAYGRERLDSLLQESDILFQFTVDMKDLEDTVKFLKAFGVHYAILEYDKQPRMVIKSEDKNEETTVSLDISNSKKNVSDPIYVSLFPEIFLPWKDKVDIKVFRKPGSDSVAIVEMTGLFDSDIEIPTQIYLQTVFAHSLDALINQVEATDFFRV